MTSSLAVVLCAVVVLQCARFGQSQQTQATLDDTQLDQLIADVFNTSTSSSSPSSSTSSENPNRSGNGDRPLNEDGCVCVPYYLCKNNSVITDGEGLIDIRIKETQCQNYLEVCCESPNRVVDPITPRPPVEPKPSGCGYRNPDGVGFRITGDQDGESQFGEFPWMAAVLREESIDGQAQRLNVYQCGGALIHPQAVITAAHCVADKGKQNSLKIRAGEWDTQTKEELFPHQDRSVTKVIVHEQFYSGALFNDIALLILDEPVEIAENVNVICLAPQGTVTPSGTRCFASGWGKNVFGQEGRYQVILKKIELPIVGHGHCQDALRKTRLGKFFELHNSFTCAGGEPGKDTCKGDGGSPLVCPIPDQPNRYYQAGIVAWGIGCGEDSTPGVYADVAKFSSWISEQMIYNQLDQNSYSYA